MKSDLICFEETELEFTDGQRAAHPADGLSVFGPFASDGMSKLKQLNYAVIGTTMGVKLFGDFAAAMKHPLYCPSGKKELLWPHFPGMEEAFHVQWDGLPGAVETITERVLLDAAADNDPHKRGYGVVELYLEAMRKALKKDQSFQCFVCVVPELVWTNCRITKKYVKDGQGNRISSTEVNLRKGGQSNMFEEYPADQYNFSLDFRRQLKARAMELRVPVQIVRDTTLRLSDENRFGIRGLTPMADRAWNLGTAMYYKGVGKPWKLAGARKGVCYIGIAFKNETPGGRNACCAAQMFLSSGDGMVFLGDFGPWYSPVSKQYYLPKEKASALLKQVLGSYDPVEAGPLTEIFLHCRSKINEEAYEGYKEACPPGVKLVVIRVAPEVGGIRIYRKGTRPVMRGTFWPVNEHRGFLWASGFAPRTATYAGSDLPVPLRLQVQYGEPDIVQVARDIFDLSKLNYNACKLGEDQPVTVKFSNAVGEILIANRNLPVRLPNFKYYI